MIKNMYSYFTASRKRALLAVFLLHTLVMLGILSIMLLTGKDYADFLLRDDGYYDIAASFLEGNFSGGRIMGPGLPIIFMPIHLFPELWHPFIRLIISQTTVYFILFIVSKLTKSYLSTKQFLYGGILIVLHPTFIQWTFRTSVDLYLALFLGCFILCLVFYFRDKKWYYLLFSLLFFGFGIFIRPSFVFIPVFLMFGAFTFKHFYLFKKYSIGLLLLTFGLFYVNSLYVTPDKGSQDLTSGRENNVLHSFMLTETILETKEYHKGTVEKYHVEAELIGVEHIINKINNFKSKYPDAGFIESILIFARNKPGIFIAKFILSPIYFFSLTSREFMSYIFLFVSIIWLFASYKGLKSIFIGKNIPEIKLILIIILGYFALHWFMHSYSRYSLALIPYLFIWGGVFVDRAFQEKTLSIRKKHTEN